MLRIQPTDDLTPSQTLRVYRPEEAGKKKNQTHSSRTQLRSFAVRLRLPLLLHVVAYVSLPFSRSVRARLCLHSRTSISAATARFKEHRPFLLALLLPRGVTGGGIKGVSYGQTVRGGHDDGGCGEDRARVAGRDSLGAPALLISTVTALSSVGSSAVGGNSRAAHVPLDRRATEPTYEERRLQLVERGGGAVSAANSYRATVEEFMARDANVKEGG